MASGTERFVSATAHLPITPQRMPDSTHTAAEAATAVGCEVGAIVKSLTDEIIMPIVGAIFGNIDFSDRYIVLSGEVAPGTPLAADVTDIAAYFDSLKEETHDA
jgi:hypothetical protein